MVSVFFYKNKKKILQVYLKQFLLEPQKMFLMEPQEQLKKPLKEFAKEPLQIFREIFEIKTPWKNFC